MLTTIKPCWDFKKCTGYLVGKFKGNFNPRNYSQKYMVGDNVTITLNLFTSYIIYKINDINIIL